MKSLPFLLLFWLSALWIHAATYVDPVDDGWVTPTYTDTTDYVEVGANGGEGALVFSTASVKADGSVFDLEINPYGEPMYVNTVNVYGFTSTSGTFSVSNYGEGTLLGTYTNLSSLTGGEQALMNITSFVDSVQTSDFGILLEAVGSNEGPDILSSTRYFEGDPSAIEDLPEPSPVTLLMSSSIVALLFACLRLRRQRLAAS